MQRKQIQLMFPRGLQNFIRWISDLHIEMAFENVIDN